MDVCLLYFDDCPNWQVAEANLRAALASVESVTLTLREVTTAEEASALGFRGSPSIWVDGVDAFPGASVGLSCRVFQTPSGLAGAPTVEQLVEVLSAR